VGVLDLKRLLGASLALAMLAAGCTKVSQTSVAGGRVNSFTQPHVLRMATVGDVNTLNPHLGQFSTIGWVSSMTQAYLIKWDEHNNAYPELATEVPTKANGGVSKDGLTITYHLRKGVKWSDGAPFDADDVVFSTKVVLNPANNEVGRLGWDQITRIDEPDKYTVIYHLKKPYSPFIETFFSTAGANPDVLPKHLLASLPNINNTPYNSKPVGIGPFMYERWDRNQQIVMVRNPNYFRGAPKLERIIMKLIPDRNTLLSQLQAKEVDMWPLPSGNYYDRLMQLGPYTVLRQPSYFWDHLDMNITHPGLNDVVVRRALRLAWDRNERLQKIAHGVGVLSDSITPIGSPYEVKLDKIPYDPDQANKMLDQAGWVRGADGIRAKNGVKLSFSYAAVAGLQDVDNALELLRANWKQIGVELSIQHYATALFFAPLESGGVIYGNKWDITGFSWQNEAIGDYSSIYGCHSIPPQGQNDPRWCNEKAQAAMDSLFTHYEQAERNKDVAVVAKAVYDDVPVIVQDQREDLFAINKDLKNFHPNAVTPFDNMMNVDI
jgi:peptide/nickel transport system substrate-binding protein